MEGRTMDPQGLRSSAPLGSAGGAGIEPPPKFYATSPDLACIVLEAAPDAMIIIDGAGEIQFASRRVAALFGHLPQDVLGQNVELLMPERFRSRHAASREHYLRRVRARPLGVALELYGLRRDGTEFPVEVSLSPIQHLGEMLIAAAIRDISDRKRVQYELVATRILAEQSREAAVRANQAKSRFLATASHDLRQPLQTLALLNGTLCRIVSDRNAAKALAHQDQAISAMSRLLSALLDVSKLESGAVKPEPTDFYVAGIFEELRQEFAEIAAGKGLCLEIGTTEACLHSDPSLVEQILRNLVSNAIKYTRRGRVELSCVLVADGNVRLEVLDSGIGIPADQLGAIYEEFYQVDNMANRSRDGYGLGLAIVKRIVELLGLTLEVRSQVGEGSSFALLVPSAHRESSVPRREAGEAALERTAREHREKRIVILVEDNFDVRDAARMLLMLEGYEVMAVGSLKEALESARAGVDLLVTDYHLSDGETGTQVIAALRDALGTQLKSVLMTGDTSMAIRDLPRDANLRIASKPLKAEEMLLLLKELSAAGGS